MVDAPRFVAILGGMTKPIAALCALAFLLVLAPAASAATSFEISPGSNPDVAVDNNGAAHIVIDLPDEKLRYCQIPRSQTTCAVDRTLTPPAEATGRSSYVFLPAPGRVVIATHRCCSPDATLAYESTDNGATFGGPVTIGNLDFKGNAVFGPGEAISGIDTGGRYQRMPLGGPQATAQAMLSAGFATPTSSSLGLLGGTTPLKVSADGDNTTFHRQNGAGDPNDAGTWAGPTPVAPPGLDVRVASGSAGLVMIYRTGSPGRLQARKFDGSGFGPPATLSTDDPIESDITTDGSGRFTAVWTENGVNPNELRISQSSDGVNWSQPVAIQRSQTVDDFFHTQVAAAPDGQGFAVSDTNSSTGKVYVTPLEPEPPIVGPGGESPVLATTTVADQEITFFGPGPCVQPPEKVTLRVTSKRKKKLARNRRAKISIVVFSVDRTKKTDRKAAFKQAFSTASMRRGSVHRVRAVVTLKPVVKGAFKAKKKTLKGRFNVCG